MNPKDLSMLYSTAQHATEADKHVARAAVDSRSITEFDRILCQMIVEETLRLITPEIAERLSRIKSTMERYDGWL